MAKCLSLKKTAMKNFIKSYSLKHRKVIINLKVKGVPLTTGSFPHARKILKKSLPSIFRSKCFNPENLSFYKESAKTELGHLFEHILLEYMSLIKIPYVSQISYSGRTFWDKDKTTGQFRVEITCSLPDWPIFVKALSKSIKLMDLILKNPVPPKIWRQFETQTAPRENKPLKN